MRIVKQGSKRVFNSDSIKTSEQGGRVCYKSEASIKEGSAIKFIGNIAKSGHGSVLEHAMYHLEINWDVCAGEPHHQTIVDMIEDKHVMFSMNPVHENLGYMTFNLRTLYEYFPQMYAKLIQNPSLSDAIMDMNGLKVFSPNSDYPYIGITTSFITNRGVTHELVRHRTLSFSQESTRYCNYSKDQFDNQLTCILPVWESDNLIGEWTIKKLYVERFLRNMPKRTFIFLKSLIQSEKKYFQLLKEGATAQQAREILPNALKAEIYVSGTLENIRAMVALRTPSGVHPQCKELIQEFHSDMVKDGFADFYKTYYEMASECKSRGGLSAKTYPVGVYSPSKKPALISFKLNELGELYISNISPYYRKFFKFEIGEVIPKDPAKWNAEFTRLLKYGRFCK